MENKSENKKGVCANCAIPADTNDNGVCVGCEHDLVELERVWEVRDHAIEGEV